MKQFRSPKRRLLCCEHDTVSFEGKCQMAMTLSAESCTKQSPTGGWFRHLLRHQQGSMLLEALVVVGLLVGALSMAIQGLGAGSRGIGIVHDLTTAQNIARSQMESTYNAVYCPPPCSYQPISVPAGYTVTAEAQSFGGTDTNVEQIVVTVRRDGESLVQLRGMKVNR